MRGFLASSRIEFKSAPSANILTLSEAARGWDTPCARLNSELWLSMATPLPVNRLDNPVGRLAQRTNSEVRAVRPALTITMVDKHRLAAGAVTGFHIAPAVSHHEAGCEVNIPAARGIHQKPRHWLAASTMRGIVVRANADIV